MRLTPDHLRKKRAREKEIQFVVTNDAGEPEEGTMLFRAIGSDEYDDLIAEYPPSPEQRKKGLNYDMNAFAPALLSRVCVDPSLTREEWRDIWTSPQWNRGELSKLMMEAVDVCTAGLDIPFTRDG